MHVRGPGNACNATRDLLMPVEKTRQFTADTSTSLSLPLSLSLSLSLSRLSLSLYSAAPPSRGDLGSGLKVLIALLIAVMHLAVVAAI
jgi:hypothetical protein